MGDYKLKNFVFFLKLAHLGTTTIMVLGDDTGGGVTGAETDPAIDMPVAPAAAFLAASAFFFSRWAYYFANFCSCFASLILVIAAAYSVLLVM